MGNSTKYKDYDEESLVKDINESKDKETHMMRNFIYKLKGLSVIISRDAIECYGLVMVYRNSKEYDKTWIYRMAAEKMGQKLTLIKIPDLINEMSICLHIMRKSVEKKMLYFSKIHNNQVTHYMCFGEGVLTLTREFNNNDFRGSGLVNMIDCVIEGMKYTLFFQ